MSDDINVGAISESLNNKVDLNQLNTNTQGLEYVSGLGMPSSKYIDLTLGASGATYTAPANGWVHMRGVSTSTSQYSNLEIIDANGNSLYVVTSQPSYTGYNSECFCPVLKGDRIKTHYNISVSKIRFIYAVGSEPSA